MNGFFEGASNATLTFGSDFSVGSVTLQNSVSITPGDTARVAVYNTGNQSAASSTAYLTGDWTGARLIVGDAATPYTGTIYMTGDNALASVEVLGGRLSTYTTGTNPDFGTLVAVGSDVIVRPGAALELYGAETVGSVQVERAVSGGITTVGLLEVYNSLTASSVLNEGFLVVDAGTDISGTDDGAGAMLQTSGSIITDTIANADAALLVQRGGVTVSGQTENDGTWSAPVDATLTTGTLVGDGIFCLETDGVSAAICGEDETATATTLTLVQTGDSQFDGAFAGYGNLTKSGSGALTLTEAQILEGMLDVTEGAVITATGSNAQFHDSMDLTIAPGASVTLNTADTIDHVTNDGALTVTAAHQMSSLDLGADSTTLLDADTDILSAVVNAGSLRANGAGTFGSLETTQNASTVLNGHTDVTGAVINAGNLNVYGTGTFEALTSTQTGQTVLHAAVDVEGNVINDGYLDVQREGTFGAFTSGDASRTIISAALDIEGDVNLGGSTDLAADLVILGTMSNAENGALGIDGMRKITAAGLSGAGDITLATHASLTFEHTGGVSSYNGDILDADGTGVFIKTGAGELRFGADAQIDLTDVRIENGILALDGEDQLNHEMAMTVSQNGSLHLLDGDLVRTQTIQSLSGSGLIELGQNTLTVAQGGSFTGDFSGTGNVLVEDGSFSVNTSLNSPDGSLTVSNPNTMITAGTVVTVQSVNVTNNGQLSLGGNGPDSMATVSTERLVVDTGSTLTLGNGSPYTPGAEGFNVVTASAIDIGGRVRGIGTVSGPAIVTSADPLQPATISPGASPGVLAFSDLTLGAASLLEIEVLDSTLARGVGYDVATVAGAFTLQAGSTLNVVELSGDIGYNPNNYDLGATTQFVEFTPGQISGHFGNISHTNSGAAAGSFAVNLPTGTLVGLGATNLASLAKTDQERAFLEGMTVGQAEGILQFYGGNFLEDLTAAQAAGTSTTRVFDDYSAQSYLSFSDSARLAATTLLPDDIGQYLGVSGVFGNVNSAAAATPDNGMTQGYSVRANSFGGGVSRDAGSVTILLSFGAVTSDVAGQYLSASGSGIGAGAAVIGRLAGSENATWFGSLKAVNMTVDSDRSSLRDQRQARDVGIRAIELGLGATMEHSVTENTVLRLQSQFTFGKIQQDGFTETNASGAILNLATVEESNSNYRSFDLGMELEQLINDRTTLLAGLSFQSGSGADTVFSTYDDGQAGVIVKSDTAMDQRIGISVGLRHHFSEIGSIAFNVGATQDWKGETNAFGGVNFTSRF